MAKQNPIIIIGAGQCGIKAAETLRQKEYKGDLILIGEEEQPPYQRPPLSKAFLKGEMEEDSLYLKAQTFYDEMKIETLLNERVLSINSDKQDITLQSGSTLPYAKLLIATGTRARNIPLQGSDLDEVYTLRTINDVKKLTNALEETKRVVIIGAGYIGLEVAASLRMRGHDITIVEQAERILNRVVSPEVSAFFTKLHHDNGVKIETSTTTQSINGNKKVTSVSLADGRELPCDLVLLATGAEPVTELAEQAGAKCINGIYVDKTCATSLHNIYAAGDCASFYSDRYGRDIRLESVQNAIDQGKTAADAMLGRNPSYNPLPWFWSDQYDVKLQIVGLSQGYDKTVIEGDVTNKAFSIHYFKNGDEIAVDAINQPRTHMLSRRSML